ncbi:Uncharacterised protein [Mycobacteroides abscessus subsp. abscessus]|nr:Uncharacterised protein [Mycobacteroides abscessus subsp. abscessus]
MYFACTRIDPQAHRLHCPRISVRTSYVLAAGSTAHSLDPMCRSTVA